MAISEEAKKITDWIYKTYGTGGGYLFGIHSSERGAVEAIVDVTVKHLRDDTASEEIEEDK